MVQQVSGDAIYCHILLDESPSETFFAVLQLGLCYRRPPYDWSLVPVLERERVTPSVRVAGNFENLKAGVVMPTDCCS